MLSCAPLRKEYNLQNVVLCEDCFAKIRVLPTSAHAVFGKHTLNDVEWFLEWVVDPWILKLES